MHIDDIIVKKEQPIQLSVPFENEDKKAGFVQWTFNGIKVKVSNHLVYNLTGIKVLYITVVFYCIFSLCY